MRPQSVGASADFELEHAELDPDLQDHVGRRGRGPRAPGARRARDHTANPGSRHPSPDASLSPESVRVKQVSLRRSRRRHAATSDRQVAAHSRISIAICRWSFHLPSTIIAFRPRRNLHRPDARKRGRHRCVVPIRQHRSSDRIASMRQRRRGRTRTCTVDDDDLEPHERLRAATCRPGDLANRTVPLSIMSLRLHFGLSALLAQLAEQLTLNQRVVGSSPTGGISTTIRPIPTSHV